MNGEILVILPAYNEELSIGNMVLRARQHADHIIVVDDGSTDHTSEVAKLAGAEIIRHTFNKGKGAALKTGFEEASRIGAKVIVTMDADGQHDPEEISKLIGPIIAGQADVVNGSRYLNGNGGNTPFYRRIGQNVLDKATNLNSGLNITDTQSGFRAFAKHALPTFKFKQSGFGIESEMLMEAANAGLKIKELGIEVRYGVNCSTENPVSHGVSVLVNVLHNIELNKPQYYFTVPAMLAVSVALMMGLNFLQRFYHGGSLEMRPTLLVILLALITTFMILLELYLHSMSRLVKEN